MSFKELNTLLQLSEKDGAKIIFKPLLDALEKINNYDLSSKTHENLTESANLVGLGASTLEFLVFLLKKQETLKLDDAKNALQQWKNSVPERRQDRRLEEVSSHLKNVLSSNDYVMPDSDLTPEQQKAITILRGIAKQVGGLINPKYMTLPTGSVEDPEFLGTLKNGEVALIALSA
ncbi:MAG: hypothetical protein EBT55_05345 [Proteobacteria bacterium]|nr:hypothetical protein [Pseudomonadota bacterium]